MRGVCSLVAVVVDSMLVMFVVPVAPVCDVGNPVTVGCVQRAVLRVESLGTAAATSQRAPKPCRGTAAATLAFASAAAFALTVTRQSSAETIEDSTDIAPIGRMPTELGQSSRMWPKPRQFQQVL